MTESRAFTTPRPWFVESDGIYDATRSRLVVPIGDSDQDRADAELIVDAVNAHEHLRASDVVLQRVEVVDGICADCSKGQHSFCEMNARWTAQCQCFDRRHLPADESGSFRA